MPLSRLCALLPSTLRGQSANCKLQAASTAPAVIRVRAAFPAEVHISVSLTDPGQPAATTAPDTTLLGIALALLVSVQVASVITGGILPCELIYYDLKRGGPNDERQ